MHFPLSAERQILAGLLGVFLCRAAIASTIIPPWQGPDEPTHFALAYGLTQPPEKQLDVEGAVLRSMVRHGWWDLYEDPPPDPLPSSFDAVFGLGPGTLAQPLYYGLGATALRASRPASLERAYAHLRVLSIVLALVTVALGWAGTRLLFGPEIALGATAIAAMHPQFLLTAISVNADALLNVCGAFVWWQAARVVTGRDRDFSTALMLAGGFAAVFTKRAGIALLGLAVVVAVASFAMNRSRGFTRRDALFVAIPGLVLVAALAAVASWSDALLDTWTRFVGNALTIRRPLDQSTIPDAFSFARMTVDYFWLIGGWLRFQPPQQWLWITRVMLIAGIAGTAVALVRLPSARPALLLAWVFVAAQVGAMLLAVFWTLPSAPQARYLFPTYAPLTALMFIGLRHAVPQVLQPQWPAALALVLMALDVTGFTTVHIPTYVH
jgi:hypothetical protein